MYAYVGGAATVGVIAGGEEAAWDSRQGGMPAHIYVCVSVCVCVCVHVKVRALLLFTFLSCDVVLATEKKVKVFQNYQG